MRDRVIKYSIKELTVSSFHKDRAITFEFYFINDEKS